MIGIIGAMESEIQLIKERMSVRLVKEVRGYTFYEGVLSSKEIVLVRCGVGKVASAILVTLFAELYDLTCIVNIGTSGGLAPYLKPCDIVIGSKVAYHDVDITAFGSYPYGQMSGCPRYFESDPVLVEKVKKLDGIVDAHLYVGMILSGDSFVMDAKRMEHIVQTHFSEFEVLAVEMESAAIAQCAYFLNIPFLILRSVSDVVGKETQAMQFEEFVQLSADHAAMILEALLKTL